MLGQVAVDGKSNETAALPALLEMLDIEGTVVTADAMHTQRDAAERITGKGGDYVFALKGNQGSLHKDAKAWLADSGNAGKMLSHQEAGRGHGREETRTATVCHDIGPLQDAHRWPGLAAIGKVESVNAEVKFPKSAEAEFPSFRCFGGEPVQSSVVVSFLGRPRFFGGGGGVIGAFVRTCSGMRSACFLSL